MQAARPAIQIVNAFLPPCHVDGRRGSHDCRELSDRRGPRIVAQTCGGLQSKGGCASGGILTVEFEMSDFLNNLEKWQNLIKQHDAIVDETLFGRMGTGVVQDHFLMGVAKYTRCEQLRKDLVEYISAKETPRRRQRRSAGRSYTHGVRHGPRAIREEVALTTQRKMRWQRSTSSTHVRTLWKTGTPRKAKGKSGQGGKDKGEGKNKDGKVQLECSRCGKTSYMKKD